MTVRGGKNRVLICTGAGLLLIAIVLFYHNAATRLDDARTKYDKCHLNEESLSAQLQVILEYKSRLEKSLQQEKSEHAQTKEEAKNKAEEERQTRERDNMESINKFTALQQQYKLLQSQHEDVTQELEKVKQDQLAAEEKKSSQEEQISSLTRQVKLLQEGRQSDATLLQSKLSKLEADYESLQKDKSNSQLLKEKADLQRELTECLRKTPPQDEKKTDAAHAEDERIAPSVQKRSSVGAGVSSTVGGRGDNNLMAGAVINYNTSTPLINPEALQSQDRTSTSPSNFVRRVGPILPDYNQQQQVAAPMPMEVERPRGQLPAAAPPLNQAANQMFAYDENEMDHRKEEEDDDVDQLDYGDKLVPAVAAQPRPARGLPIHHDGVMLSPK